MRQIFASLLVLTLAACGNAPQQPSDVVDDKTADAPGYGLESPVSPDFAEDAEDANGNAAVPSIDPVETASVPAPPADLSALAGRWAPDADACANGAGAFAITADRFDGPERKCAIASAVHGGDGSYTATLSCPQPDAHGNGDLVKLAPDGEGLELSFIGGNEPPQSLIRCP